MFIKRFLLGGLLVLLVFGALGGMRRGGYEDAYRQGFMAGQQTAAASGESSGAKGAEEASETAVPPHNHSRFDRRGHGHGWGWGFFPLAFLIGGFFKFAIFALIIGGLFKFMGFGRWRHSHRPPWAQHHKGSRTGDDNASNDTPGDEKSPEDVEPDIKTS